MARIDELKRLALRGDEESQYQLGMEYVSFGDFSSAIKWLEKISANPSHSRYGKAVSYLAQFHDDGVYPGFSREQSKSEAVRLYKLIADDPNSVITRLHLGLIYCEGIGVRHNPVEGKQLIEKSVKQIIDMQGNDSYLSAHECSRIGAVYSAGETNVNKDPSIEDLKEGIRYLKKAIDRWDDRYPSELNRKDLDKKLLAHIEEHLNVKTKLVGIQRDFLAMAGEESINTDNNLEDEKDKEPNKTYIDSGKEKKRRERSSSIIGIILQTVLFAAFVYILAGTKLVHDMITSNPGIPDLLLPFSPFFFYILAIGFIGALFLQKRKRYIYLFYIAAITLQTIMSVIWFHELNGSWSFWGTLLIVFILVILSIPGAITGMLRNRKPAAIIFLLAVGIYSGVIYNMAGSITIEDELPVLAEPIIIPISLPPLMAQDFTLVNTPEIYNLNSWETPTYTNDFYIKDQLYSQGIGLYILSKKLKKNEIGIAEITYKTLDQYKYLSFELGADSNWGCDPNAGTFCISVLGDNEYELYCSGWQDYQFYDSVSVKISGYDQITLKLEEIKGSKGTLNVIFGDLMMTD